MGYRRWATRSIASCRSPRSRPAEPPNEAPPSPLPRGVRFPSGWAADAEPLPLHTPAVDCMTAHTFLTPTTVFSLALGCGGCARARCVAIGGRTQTTLSLTRFTLPAPGLFLECVRVHCGCII